MLDEQSSIHDMYPESKLVYLVWSFFFLQVCNYLYMCPCSCSYYVFGFVIDFEIDIEGKRFMWQVILLNSLQNVLIFIMIYFNAQCKCILTKTKNVSHLGHLQSSIHRRKTAFSWNQRTQKGIICRNYSLHIWEHELTLFCEGPFESLFLFFVFVGKWSKKKHG